MVLYVSDNNLDLDLQDIDNLDSEYIIELSSNNDCTEHYELKIQNDVKNSKITNLKKENIKTEPTINHIYDNHISNIYSSNIIDDGSYPNLVDYDLMESEISGEIDLNL